MSIRSTTEKTFYENLKKLAKGHWTRIENSVAAGTPDTHFAGLYTDADDGKQHPVSAFIELKVIHSCPDYAAPITLRFERNQLPWLVEHSVNYGTGILAVRFDRPANKYSEVMLIRATPLLPKILKLPFGHLIQQPTCQFFRLLNLGIGLPQFIHNGNIGAKPRWVQVAQRKPILVGEE